MIETDTTYGSASITLLVLLQQIMMQAMSNLFLHLKKKRKNQSQIREHALLKLQHVHDGSQ